jgi:hypothetical protein
MPCNDVFVGMAPFGPLYSLQRHRYRASSADTVSRVWEGAAVSAFVNRVPGSHLLERPAGRDNPGGSYKTQQGRRPYAGGWSSNLGRGSLRTRRRKFGEWSRQVAPRHLTDGFGYKLELLGTTESCQ